MYASGSIKLPVMVRVRQWPRGHTSAAVAWQLEQPVIRVYTYSKRVAACSTVHESFQSQCRSGEKLHQYLPHTASCKRGFPCRGRGALTLMAQSPQLRQPGSDVGHGGDRARRRNPRQCPPIGKSTIRTSRAQGGIDLVPSHCRPVVKPPSAFCSNNGGRNVCLSPRDRSKPVRGKGHRRLSADFCQARLEHQTGVSLVVLFS